MDFYTCGGSYRNLWIAWTGCIVFDQFCLSFCWPFKQSILSWPTSKITKNLFWCWCFSKKNFLTFLCFGHSKQTLSKLIPGSSCLITHTYVYPWIIQFTYVPFANLQKEEEWHLTIFSIWMPTLRNATRVTLTGTYYWVVLERYVFKL